MLVTYLLLQLHPSSVLYSKLDPWLPWIMGSLQVLLNTGITRRLESRRKGGGAFFPSFFPVSVNAALTVALGSSH